MELLVKKNKKKIKKFGWSFRLAFDALNYCLLAEGKANLKPYDILQPIIF